MRSSTRPDDRTTKARIRDAAIDRFGRFGISSTSIRAIAADAGVAPSHVIHYFGSKEGLRRACDEHIAAIMRETQADVVAEGSHVDPIQVLRHLGNGDALLRYVARILVESDAGAGELIDQILTDSQTYIRGLAETGWITPGSRERDTLLCLWSLGMMAMNTHLGRHLNVDLLHFEQDPASLKPLLSAYIELFSTPLLTEQGVQLMSGMFADQEKEGT